MEPRNSKQFYVVEIILNTFARRLRSPRQVISLRLQRSLPEPENPALRFQCDGGMEAFEVRTRQFHGTEKQGQAWVRRKLSRR